MKPKLSFTVFTLQSAVLRVMFSVICMLSVATVSITTASAGNRDSSYDVNVLVIEYFHINASGDTTFDPNIKTALEAGWWMDYSDYNKTLQSVADQVSAMRTAAEEGSRYLLYKYPASQFSESQRPQAALRYRIVDTVQKFEQVPFIPATGGYLDYDGIMRANNICDYVNNRGVREVWLLKGAHKDAFSHSESKMAGPFGNISNGSLGGPSDMPVCNHTYRVYTHTYDRWDLFPEVWSHQLEAEMEHISRTSSNIDNRGTPSDTSDDILVPDLFGRFNVPCLGSTDYGCAPADPSRVMSKNTGLVGNFTGEYFSGITPPPPPGTPATYTRADAEINFSWSDDVNGSPLPGTISADNFSARWTGTFVPTKTEIYSFYVAADDGAKLWLDGELLLGLGTDFSRGFIQERPLVAGRPYPIQMDYYEARGGAAVRLLWSSDTTPPLPEKDIPGRCGNAHTAPNGRYNYDRSNPKPHGSDCMDWNPDGLGPLSPIRCYTADQPLNPALNEGGWGCGKPGYHIFDNFVLNYTTWHWQNMPGRNNAKTYQNSNNKLRNWWDVHGDFDGVKTCNATLLDSSTCVADLAIVYFFGSPTPINAGHNFYYFLSVSNNGPGTVPDGRVKVTLPAGSNFVPGGYTSPECDASGLTVTCYLGKRTQGENRTFVLTVTPPLTNGNIMATATTVLPGTFEDKISTNDTATATTTVVFPPPTITSFNPTGAPPGTLVSITGTNFIPGGGTTVTLNGTPAMSSVDGGGGLNFFVPTGATTGKIKVTTAAGSVESLTNFIVPPPPVCFPITQVLTLGDGTGPTNEEVKVTFLGQIANVASLTTNPTTSRVLKICPDTRVQYAATATKGTLVCKINKNRAQPNGTLRINDMLRCSNRSGGGGNDVDIFYVKPQ